MQSYGILVPMLHFLFKGQILPIGVDTAITDSLFVVFKVLFVNFYLCVFTRGSTVLQGQLACVSVQIVVDQTHMQIFYALLVESLHTRFVSFASQIVKFVLAHPSVICLVVHFSTFGSCTHQLLQFLLYTAHLMTMITTFHFLESRLKF